MKAGTRLIVATSGGSDSVALLRVLAALAPRRTWRLNVARVGHVQHHLRNPEQAEGDADFVAKLADQLELPYLRADLDPPVGPVNREAWARRARYGALARMAQAFDAQAILTAHHADDQLETLLMRMLRGASVEGLAGIAWRRRLSRDEAAPEEANGVRPLLLRPMLAVDRAGVREFLADIGQPWREDHTNQDITRLRARLRRNVLPLLQEIRMDAPARAVALGDHLRQMAHVLEEAIARAADRVTLADGQKVIDRAEARLMHGIVLIGLLRRLLTEAGIGRDRLGGRTLNPIVRAVRDTRGGERTFDLGGAKVLVTRDVVMIRV